MCLREKLTASAYNAMYRHGESHGSEELFSRIQEDFTLQGSRSAEVFYYVGEHTAFNIYAPHCKPETSLCARELMNEVKGGDVIIVKSKSSITADTRTIWFLRVLGAISAFSGKQRL